MYLKGFISNRASSSEANNITTHRKIGNIMKSNDEKGKNGKIYKIVIYIIAFLITITLLPNAKDVVQLNSFAKAIVYIVVFSGGILGGLFGTWLNERFPYPLYKLAERFNLEGSVWFRMIGAQLMGVIVGVIFFEGIIAKIFGIQIK